MSKSTTPGMSAYRTMRSVWIVPPQYPNPGGQATSSVQRNDWFRVPKSGCLVHAVEGFFGHLPIWDGKVEYNIFLGRSRINPRTDPTVSPLITDNGVGGWGYFQIPASDFYKWYPQDLSWVDDLAPVPANPGLTTGAFMDIMFQSAEDEHNAAQEKPLFKVQLYPQPYELRPNEWIHAMSFGATSAALTPPATYNGFDYQALFRLYYEPLIRNDGSYSPRRAT